MPREDDSREVGNEVERQVMMALLDGRRMLERSELVLEVAGSAEGQSARDAADAIVSLCAAGLVHVIEGRFLFASQPARRLDGLGL